MDPEEDKLEMAMGGLGPEGEDESDKSLDGVSPEEIKFLQALHLLGIKPKLGSPEDVAKLLFSFGKVKDEPKTHHVEPTEKMGNFHFPKLPLFFGEEGKGEANWDSFKYEVEALENENIFKQEQILLGIRRACKGKAADTIRRLGTGASLKLVKEKFESDYGSIESRESIMRKFYGSKQDDDETVSSFACRLEETFDKAVALGALKKSDTIILKEVLHAGLTRDLKHLSLYHCDKIKKYDDFKKELRKLEASLKDSEKGQASYTCKAATHSDSHNKDMNELKDLLKQMNERIEKLEKGKDDQRPHQYPYRGNHRGRGNRGRGNRGGRGGYQTQRPLANNNFPPTCWECNEKGHKQNNCPKRNYNYNADITCYTCNQKGHRQAQCPNA